MSLVSYEPILVAIHRNTVVRVRLLISLKEYRCMSIICKEGEGGSRAQAALALDLLKTANRLHLMYIYAVRLLGVLDPTGGGGGMVVVGGGDGGRAQSTYIYLWSTTVSVRSSE
jgi:hypothetical protein